MALIFLQAERRERYTTTLCPLYVLHSFTHSFIHLFIYVRLFDFEISFLRF